MEYTPQEKRFLERLGFTPGPWQMGELTEHHRLPDSFAVFKKNDIGKKNVAAICITGPLEYSDIQSQADGLLMAKAPDLFLALFHVAHTEQHFCQEYDEVARFELMIDPLESATNKTWPDLCRIWEECKC